VVAAGNGRGSVAIISTDGKPSVALPEGAEVVPGVTVLEVHARHVLLRDGGVSKRIDLVADDKALALPGPVSATPTPAPAPAPASNLVPPPLPMEQQRPATVMPAAPQVTTTSTPPSN